MKKIITTIRVLSMFLFIWFIFCGDDPYNPLDRTDPRYQPMELQITTDSASGLDTISITTDSALELGIESRFLDRIDSVRIDYDLNKITDQQIILKRSDLSISNGTTKISLSNPHIFTQPGIYTVEVFAYTVNGDDVSSLITVIVGGVAPRINRNPAGITVPETDTARFSIAAAGTMPLRYFWYFTSDTSKNGQIVNPSDTLDSTFTDEFVETSDSGFFYCVVKNDFGTVQSSFAQLKVSPQVLPADAPTVFFEKDSSSGEESVDAVITLKLSAAYNKDVLVRVAVLASSQAKDSIDYSIVNSTVLFPAHSTSANFNIDITNDDVGESDEVLALQLSSARNARMDNRDKHYYTILDDDVADSSWPELYFTSASGSGIEGQNAAIDVALGLKTSTWQYAVSVKCRVSGSSSASKDDYILMDSVLTFNVNETSRRIVLQTIKDKISENDETVKLELFQPGKAVLSGTRPIVYTYTIKDGDQCAIYFDKMEMTGIEPDSINLKDSIKVNLSMPSVNEVTVKYEIVPEISTAINQGTDYLLPGEGFLKFAPGIQTAYIPVVVIADTIKEASEIFALKLTNPSGGAVVQNSDPFKYIIIDNKSVTLSFKTSQTTVVENVGDIAIPVILSKPASDTIRVDYRIFGNAQSTDADYIIKNGSSRTLIFAPGDREKTVDITIVDDNYDEPDKSFSIALENPLGGAVVGLLDKHTVTIVNNDKPNFSFASAATVVNEGAGKVAIPVKLSNPSRMAHGIRYTLSSASTAEAGKDFVPFSSDTAIFSAGDSLLYIDLVLIDDNIEEVSENIIINLLALDTTTLPGSITTISVTIADNDAPASVAFAQDTVSIDESSDTVKLPLVVSGQTDKSISVAFQVGYMSANCDTNDFSIVSTGRIALNAPENRFIVLKVKDDRTYDENDTLHITILDPQNTTLGAVKTCKIAIRDNDYKVVMQRADTNGTITPSGEQSVTRGTPLPIVALPRPHYHFTGWNVTSGINIGDASKPSTAITVTTAGGTVTANFAIDSFNVTFAAENGSVVPNGQVKAAWGDVLSPVPTPQPGYNFLTWSVTADSIEPVGVLNSITTKFRVKGTGTIRALHSNKAYSIEVATVDARFGTVTPVAVQEKNWAETFEIKATANTNAKFVQWRADSDSLLKSISDTLNATATVTVRRSGKITAIFAPDSFTVTLQSSNTTMGRVDPASKKMTFFDSTQITATAETGYSFTGWTVTVGVEKVVVNSSTAAQTVVKALSANATLLANFSPIPYAITASVSPSGSGTVVRDPATSPQPYNTPLRLTANPNAGWKFDHWTGVPASQENSNPANLTVGTNNSYTAVFIPQTYTLYFLNYAGDTATTSIASQQNISHGVATTITASVTVNPLYTQKYVFTGVWVLDSGSAEFGAGNTITLTSNAKIRPALSKLQYSLGVVTPQPAGGSVSLVNPAVAGPYDYGTPVSLSATPNTGWQFVNWTASAGAIPTGSNTAGSAILTANTNYSAVFTKRAYSLTVSSPNATVTLNPPIPTFYYDSATTFSATVSGYNTAQYNFNNTWTATNATFNSDFSRITLTGDAVATPVLTVRQYTYSVAVSSAAGSGTVTVDLASPRNYGTTLTFTASPATGWKVRSWSGGNITPNPANPNQATSSLTGNTSYSVTFEPETYSLTITTPSNGRVRDSIGGIMSGTYSFPFGYVVRLNALADTGYQFSSWTGASGTAVSTITMDGNKNVGASFTSIPGAGGIIYVWKGATGSGTGTSWANAYTDLQTALTNAADGATIWVARGVFSPIDASTPFIPKTGTFLYGGFNGFETALSQRLFSEHFTELNGSTNSTIMRLTTAGVTVNGFVFSNASGYGVVVATAATNSTIEDCVFKNISTIAVNIQSGATVANRNATIRRCVFHSNNGTTASGKGVSIANLARRTLIENCVFANNAGSGPAITDLNTNRNSDSVTNIICCTVINNSNTGTTPGGIRSVGNMRLRGCIIYGNTNQNGGLGMQVDSTWIVEDCDIQSHSTTAGILRKDAAGFAGNNNMDINPSFTYNGTPLTDGAWFAQSSNHSLLPGQSALRTADFISNKPSSDIRKIVRGATFDFGAYQH